MLIIIIRKVKRVISFSNFSLSQQKEKISDMEYQKDFLL